MDTVVLVIRVVSVLPVVRMIISGTEEKACLYVTSQKPVNSTGGGSIPSCNAVVMRGNNTLASFFLVCFWFWYALRAYYCWSGMACNLRLTNAVFRARRRNSSRTKKLIINHWKGKSFSRSLFQSTSTSPCCPQKKKKKKKKKKQQQRRRLQCDTHPTAPQRPPWSKSLIGFQFLFPTLAWLLSDIDIDNPGTLLRIALVLNLHYYYYVLLLLLSPVCMILIPHPSSKPAKHRNRPKRDQKGGSTLWTCVRVKLCPPKFFFLLRTGIDFSFFLFFLFGFFLFLFSYF